MAVDRNADTAIRPSPLNLEEGQGRRVTPVVRVDFGALSHAGRVRAQNEDHFLVARISRALDVLQSDLPDGDLPVRIEQSGYALVVADGMGGMAGGERASRLAIRTAVRFLLEAPKWPLSLEDKEVGELLEQMRDYFREVDRVLVEGGRADRGVGGMGTTLTAVLTVGDYAFVVHAGDSRAYLCRGGTFKRLTRDHTVAQLLADSGVIPLDEVATHPERHVLTNLAGGTSAGVLPEVTTQKLADGDRLLVCTDGLTEMVDEGRINEVLGRNADPQAACRALVKQALDRGGRDNVTVVVANYEIPTG
jgi:protein phosphatase